MVMVYTVLEIQDGIMERQNEIMVIFLYICLIILIVIKEDIF